MVCLRDPTASSPSCGPQWEKMSGECDSHIYLKVVGVLYKSMRTS